MITSSLVMVAKCGTLPTLVFFSYRSSIQLLHHRRHFRHNNVDSRRMTSPKTVHRSWETSLNKLFTNRHTKSHHCAECCKAFADLPFEVFSVWRLKPQSQDKSFSLSTFAGNSWNVLDQIQQTRRHIATGGQSCSCKAQSQSCSGKSRNKQKRGLFHTHPCDMFIG